MLDTHSFSFCLLNINLTNNNNTKIVLLPRHVWIFITCLSAQFCVSSHNAIIEGREKKNYRYVKLTLCVQFSQTH